MNGSISFMVVMWGIIEGLKIYDREGEFQGFLRFLGILLKPLLMIHGMLEVLYSKNLTFSLPYNV